MEDQNKQVGIQFARALAALGIVYFHSWVAITRFPKETAHPIPWLKDYGWLSVNLFFAISGYVICLVASRSSFRPGSFLIKRVFRLYPLWLAMLSIFAVTAWLWRGFTPDETFGLFLYSVPLLPTLNSFPFYDIGWTLQHEIAFYLIAAAVVPWFGIRGLAFVLLASMLTVLKIDLPPYVANYAGHHGEFLAGTLAFMARDKMARFGVLLPLAIGGVLLGYFAANQGGHWFPIALFFLIAGFANLNPSELSRWQRGAIAIGDASYSMYLIHPMVFMFASSIVSKFPNAPLWTEEPIRFPCIAAAITASIFSWKYFERPFIRLGNHVAGSKFLPESAAKSLA